MQVARNRARKRIAASLRRCVRVMAWAVLVAALWAGARPARAQETARAKAVSQRLMCVCGCNQILGACNHVGCSYSHGMIQEVDERVARNESDDLILQDFVQEYSQTVLAEPPAKGFSSVAWIMPTVVPFVSLFLLWEVVRRWRQRAAVAGASGPKVPAELIARARDEAGREVG